MYTCLAIDDDYAALEVITDYIASQPELKLLKTYRNSSTALAEIKKLTKPIDIIFLDIEMPEMNGLELAKLIRHKAKNLVFTTAHANYAINAYELDADAFLLKPFPQQKFISIVEKLFSKSTNASSKKHHEDFILLKSAEQRNRFIKIKLDKIYAVEAQERLTKIYLEHETIFSKSSFAEVLALLASGKGFSQVHRSFIVAESQIKTLERSYLILSNNFKIVIGRKYLDFYHKMSKKI